MQRPDEDVNSSRGVSNPTNKARKSFWKAKSALLAVKGAEALSAAVHPVTATLSLQQL
jgi:hypothetical protein